ncbi:hypothetical protein [Nostoc sp. CHAB 5715]|uniref:hypothetical protein n=1 Tax=Nostoc sp. CHAB 5715 TaxID=2780400 RepID=UPI001E58EA7F|nr:hypothetical protein [Nostoc sp. CHAB 5715]MCC5621540.1 hypothetical protein [Nostoc sp. CHAB 5715]
MILLVLWDGHLARPLYFRAGETPTLQESSLDSATPKILLQTAIAPSHQVLAVSSDRICLTDSVPLRESKL